MVKISNKTVTCGIYLYCVPSKKILACHATHAGWKQWSIPKGLQEKNEPSWQTATRELQEETGLIIGNLKVVHVFKLPAVKYQKQNKILESFLVVVDDDLQNFPFHCDMRNENSIPEVNTWKWITLHQANSWLHESQSKNLKLIKKIISECYAGVDNTETQYK